MIYFMMYIITLLRRIKWRKIIFFSYRFSGNSIIQRRKEKLIQMYLLAGKANYFPCLKNKLSHNGKSTDIWSQKFSCRHSKISTQVRDCFYFHFFLSWIYIFFCYLSSPPFLLVLSVGPKNTQVNIYSWKCQFVNLSFFSKNRC